MATLTLDTTDQMDSEFARAEKDMIARFTALVVVLRSEASVEALANLIAGGSVQDAIDLISRSTPSVGSVWIKNFVATAGNLSNSIGGAIGATAFDFDQTLPNVVEAMRSNADRVSRTYLIRQRAAALEAANSAIRDGLSPRGIARRLRDSIGLDRSQVRALDNYRAGLVGNPESSSPRAQRLRNTKGVLTASQVSNLSELYRKQLVRQKAKAIGGLEALRATHEGANAVFGQAMDLGLIHPAELERVWNTRGDTKVRTSHRSMNGQRRGFQESFISGRGSRLRFPTDPRAPIEEIAECRCLVSHRITQ